MDDARSLSDLQDRSTVDDRGVPKTLLPEGVTFRDAVTHTDDRGTVCEMFDERWDWHDAPLVFSYLFTLRPGRVKGWGMHKLHEDRYFILRGVMEVVMYDGREDAETYGLVSKAVLSEHHRRLMNIPAGIWHANANISDTEALVVNFPTEPYDHEAPDKYRLPLDTDEIPYTWPASAGW
ncbi:MAG: cupin domain-containing protein [Solirubrobacteraceae bacterium]